jgi:hypothetical protein
MGTVPLNRTTDIQVLTPEEGRRSEPRFAEQAGEQFRAADPGTHVARGEHGKVWEAVLSATGGSGLGDAVLSQNYLREALPYPQQIASIPPRPTLI